MSDGTGIIEVFADVCCPFTHVGLRRFVERRAELGRDEVRLWVRSWPLEIVNGAPLDPHLVAEEIDEIRAGIAPTSFAGFTESSFPSSSVPALALAAAGYERDMAVGEQVSLALRDALFEQGLDIADTDVLHELARRHHLTAGPEHTRQVLADHADGVARGVVGSPYFFTATGGWFCPALDVRRDADGFLRITADRAGFDAFVASCFAE